MWQWLIPITLTIVLLWIVGRELSSKPQWIGPNQYMYPEAAHVCKKRGLKLASLDDVKQITKPTTDMGWIQHKQAVRLHRGQLEGGNIQPELRFGVFCK